MAMATAAESAMTVASGAPEVGSETAALVRAARAGDRQAFAELYRRYAAMVNGILLARLPFQEVPDLVQDVFLRALSRLESLRRPEAFGGWLAALARSAAMDHHRRPESRRNTIPPPEELAAVDPRPDAEAHAALAAIRALPAAYAETLALRLVEGLTGPEIATRTGLTPGSVRVNLHRGMQLLRRALEGRGRGRSER